MKDWNTLRRFGTISALVAAVLLFGTAAASAAEPPVEVWVEFWGSQYDPETGTHGGTGGSTSVRVGLVDDSPRWAYVASGAHRDDGVPADGVFTVALEVDALKEGGEAAEIAEKLRAYPLLWEVQVARKEVEEGRVVLHVEWRRLESEGGSLKKVAGDTRTVALSEGEHHVLDFVEDAPRGDSGKRQGGVIHILAEPARWSAAPSPERLRYDFWYTFRSTGVGKRTRKLQLVGRDGEELSYRFLPVQFSVAPDQTAPGQLSRILIDVSGTVRGTRQPDGTIQLELYTMRSIETQLQGGPQYGARSYGGATTLFVTPGESVQIDLPPPQAGPGYSSAAMDGMTDVFLGADEAIVVTVNDDLDDGS